MGIAKAPNPGMPKQTVLVIATGCARFNISLSGRACVSNLTHIESSLLFNADLFLPLPIESILSASLFIFIRD
jgi:hypothetical protein